MVKFFISLILVIMLQSYPCYAGMTAFFTPSKKCETSIVKHIENAKISIDAAVYAINNKNIVGALKKAHKRGVKIRILTDRLQAGIKTSKVQELYNFGIKIRVNSKYKIELNKVAVFNLKNVITGSYNWTETASNKNSENCLFFNRNKKTVQEYYNRFNYLWQVNSKRKSDLWFNRHKNRNSK